MLHALSLNPVARPEGLAGEIVASMREPFAVLDSQLRLIDASPAFFVRFGLSATEAVGCIVFELGAGEWDTPGMRELLEVLAPMREVVEGYSLEVHHSGCTRPRVQASLRPVRIGRNEIVFYLLGFEEIRGEERTAGATRIGVRDGSSEVFAILEAGSMHIRHVEGPILELTGYDASDVEGRSLVTLLHPVEQDGVMKGMSGIHPNDPPLRSTFRMRNRDGRYLWLESSCRGVREAGEALIHLTMRDVTERKRAEEALRWLGKQTKLILDSAADGIFGVDTGGNITFINPAAARVLGYRHQELLGRSYHILLPATDGSEGSSDPVAATLEDGLTRVTEDGGFRTAIGNVLPVEITCSPAREFGVVTGAVVTFRDITERRRSEAEARRSEWLTGVGETTIALRHEINNPLTTLLAEARLLEMGGNSKEEELMMVSAICSEARRIGEVMKRLAERQNDPPTRMDGNQRMLDLTAD